MESDGILPPVEACGCNDCEGALFYYARRGTELFEVGEIGYGVKSAFEGGGVGAYEFALCVAVAYHPPCVTAVLGKAETVVKP